MNILYHLATLPPQMPQAEAISQEISILKTHFQSEVIWINPNQPFRLYIPRLLFGFHRLKQIRAGEATLKFHHFYNPDPFPFPYLRYLRRPVIYSITCGVGSKRPNLDFFSTMTAVVVADKRSLRRLQSWGLSNAFLVRTGIKTNRFSYKPLPLHSEIRLMVGSAPWTRGQFRTKGVEALLEAARQNSQLHLVFLWRGVLSAEIERRVRQMNLNSQVTILNGLVDVNQILANVHASIVLAAAPGLVKSYPHSLLESLAAGKPVLVSRAIPMADYVEETGCGVAVDHVTAADVLVAIEALTGTYKSQQQSARLAGQRDFSQQAMVASYRQVYANL
jgi:glycosyltransferase involved in cell wall biosynthesis